MAKQTKKEAAPKAAKKATIYKVVDGDVLDMFFKSTENAALLHGANCQKVMGAGIANQIRNKVAPMFYLDQYDTRAASQRLGSYSAVVVGHVEEKIKIGVNLYTQFLPGQNFDKNALVNALRSFRFSIPPEQRPELTLYLPKIGCGIGGGDWKEVEPIIKRELAEFNVIAVNYVPAKPKAEKKENQKETKEA